MPTIAAINDPRRPKPAPPEFAGEWVAWNREQTEVIAHGLHLAEVHQTALAAGHPDTVMQKVRRPDAVFIGAS